VANETILVVEDEVLVGEEIREELERFGYRVPEIVETGEAVSSAIARIHPSLILMDIRIGGQMDGIEAAAQVKATEDIPIIYLTAYSDQETLARAADTEPEAYLLKPFSQRELMANVSMCLSKPRAADSELRRSEPFLSVLNLPGFLLNAEGRIHFANTRALSLLGINNFALISGTPFSQVARLTRAGGDRRMLVASDGGEKEVVVRIEPIESVGGRILGSLVIIDSMDIKERLHLESSVVAANEALHSRLPEFDAAGEGYSVSGFLLSSPTGSGDLYDVFPLDDDHFAFYALDVMGHGILPSLFAFSLHDVVRLLALKQSDGRLPSPAELVETVNRRYAANTVSSLFFSMVYGDVDRRSGAYRYVRAGHPPLIHVPRTGFVHAEMAGGPALGVFSDAAFREGTGILQPGDRIVICSDGLLEGERRDVESGIDAFIQVAQNGRTLESRVFVASVKAAALRTVGPEVILDDASMLMIERLSDETLEELAP